MPTDAVQSDVPEVLDDVDAIEDAAKEVEDDEADDEEEEAEQAEEEVEPAENQDVNRIKEKEVEAKRPLQMIGVQLLKFDEDTLNTFLKTPVIIEEGETLASYSRFALLRSDPQELAATLCVPWRGFELNIDGQPLKILRKNMTTLA